MQYLKESTLLRIDEYRLADDILFVVDKTMIEPLNGILNQLQPGLCFKLNNPQGWLTYMDMELCKNRNGNIISRLARKSSTTYNYIKWFSFHPMYQKKGIVLGILKRIVKLCSVQYRWGDFNFYRKYFLLNGYPPNFIDKCWSQIKDSNWPPRVTSNFFVKLPYLGKNSEILKRKISDNNIGITMVGGKNVGPGLPSLYKSIPNLKQKETVYEIGCQDCSAIYIGETGRPLEKRIDEHRNALYRDDTEYSRVADHCIRFNHWPNFDNIKVRGHGKTKFERRIKEGILREIAGKNAINKVNPIIIKDQNLAFSHFVQFL